MIWWWLGCGQCGGPADTTGTADSAPQASGETDSPDETGTPVVSLPSCADGALPLTTADFPTALSELYGVPEAAAQDALAASLTAWLDGDVAQTLTAAASADYTVCQSGVLVLWRPELPGPAAVLLRDGEAAPLILGAPHPLYDTDTLDESVVLFEQTGARALIAAGAHRCTNTAASSCSGTSSVCTGASEAYRVSDMAHVTESFYQIAHRVLADRFASDLVVSVHGMSRDGISLSDGTTEPTAADAPVARLAAALAEALPEQADDITTCNDYPGATWETHLCGTTNTQGRLLNGGSCTEAASMASGRFVHLEQSRAVRDEPVAVAEALLVVLE